MVVFFLTSPDPSRAWLLWYYLEVKVLVSVVPDSLQPLETQIALQASLSMEFSRQEYWSVEPFPSPVPISKPGMEYRFDCRQSVLHCRQILHYLSHQPPTGTKQPLLSQLCSLSPSVLYCGWLFLTNPWTPRSNHLLPPQSFLLAFYSHFLNE